MIINVFFNVDYESIEIFEIFWVKVIYVFHFKRVEIVVVSFIFVVKTRKSWKFLSIWYEFHCSSYIDENYVQQLLLRYIVKKIIFFIIFFIISWLNWLFVNLFVDRSFSNWTFLIWKTQNRELQFCWFWFCESIESLRSIFDRNKIVKTWVLNKLKKSSKFDNLSDENFYSSFECKYVRSSAKRKNW